METDPIMQTRLDVAEMKGMLQALVGAHSERLTAHDIRLDTHDRRLSEKANAVARHDERIKDLEDDSTARSGKTLGTAGLVISAIVALITVANFFTP